MKKLLIFLLLFGCNDNITNPSSYSTESTEKVLNFSYSTETQRVEDITLQDVFDAAGGGNGYDKYVVLDQDVIYIGGVGVYEGNVLIEGNGAIIDLQGGTGIWAYGDEIIPTNLDMEYFTLMNGEWYGVFYGGMATGNITNCNFINNGYGVQLYDFAEIQIKNSNFIENTIYGVALVTTTPVCNINYCNAWGNGEEPWAENCPG